MIKKIFYEHRVYESVDDNSLSKAISQKTDEKNKSCNKGLKLNALLRLKLALQKLNALLKLQLATIQLNALLKLQ